MQMQRHYVQFECPQQHWCFQHLQVSVTAVYPHRSEVTQAGFMMEVNFSVLCLSLQSFENTEPSFILVTVVSRRTKRCLNQVSNPFFLGVYILYKGQSKQNRVPLDMVSHGTVHP